jgi:mannose-6-phosphate isomerase-like protein (cupin superfamily)
MRVNLMRWGLIVGVTLVVHGGLDTQRLSAQGIHLTAEAVAASMTAGDLAVDGSGSLVGAGEVTNIFPEGQKLSASSPNQLIRTRRASDPNNASVHPDVTEVYYIVDGSGTFMTGGTILDPNDRSKGSTGGVANSVGQGDFVVLPPGTVHWFATINGSVTYIETRFEAK